MNLRFLISGHTKNRCDGAFGLVKRKLKQRNVNVPADMMEVIETSAYNNTAVLGSDVVWYNWKMILGHFFIIPPSFRITHYHTFEFNKKRPGILLDKRLTTSDTFDEFQLLPTNTDIEVLRKTVCLMMMDVDMRVKIESLSSVPSAREGNRHGYLMKHILDRYYPTNNAIRLTYFEDGSSFRNNIFQNDPQ